MQWIILLMVIEPFGVLPTLLKQILWCVLVVFVILAHVPGTPFWVR